MAHSQLALNLAAQYDEASSIVPGADALPLLLPRTSLLAQNLNVAETPKNQAVTVFKAAAQAAVQLYERCKGGRCH